MLLVALGACGCSGAPDAAAVEAAPTAPTAPLPASSPPSPSPPPPPPPRFRGLAVGFDAVCGVLETGAVRCYGQGSSYTVEAHGPARAAVFGLHTSRTTLFVLREDAVVMHGIFTGAGTTLTPLTALAGASALAPWAEGVCALVSGAPRCWSPWDASRVSAPRLPAPARSLVGDASSGCRTGWERLNCEAARTVATCAQLEDERVFCWPKDRPSAREVRAAAGARSLSVSASTLLGVDRAGAAFTLTADGRGRRDEVAAPASTQAAVGRSTGACFVDTQGDVTCSGALVPTGPLDAPAEGLVPVARVHGVTSLVHAFGTTCALAGGEGWCWGSNQGGRLGVPAPDSFHPSARIAGIDDAAALFVTSGTACVRRSAGGLACWGEQLAGFGDAPWALPALHAIAGVDAVSGQTSSGVLLTASGAVRGFGELSPAYYVQTSAAPVVMEDEDLHTWTVGDVVQNATSTEIPGIAGRVVEVAAARTLACVRTSDGALDCFHRGEVRRDGALVPALSSVTRVVEAGVTRVAPLGPGICAQTTRGMRCYGVIREVDANGPSGGILRVRDEPWPLEGGADAWAGDFRWACGLRGTAVHCRMTVSPPPGEGREEQRLADVTALALGAGERGATLCGITTQRGVACVALNEDSPPTAVEGLSNVVELRLGTGFGCARHEDGTVSCWGRNESGVLPRDGDVVRWSAPERLGG